MDLMNLERQRQALDLSVAKLRKALRHWQQLVAEYEGLKEEILSAEDNLNVAGFSKIARSYDGDLVKEDEIRELAALDTSPRSAQQVIALIEHRQAYGQKNIETTQRQFFDAEAKQEELAFAAATHQGRAAETAGLPLTEIHEELDDDGYVISSRLTQPEEATAKAIADLKKAGLTDEDLREEPKEPKPAITNISTALPSPSPSIAVDKRSPTEAVATSPGGDGSHDESERPTVRKKSVSFTADTKEPLERPRSLSRDGKKSVSFNDKIAVMPSAPPADTRSVSFSPQVEEIPALPEGPISPNMLPLTPGDVEKPGPPMPAGDEGRDASKGDVATAQDAILPEDESPEDARLRREMLEYHLNEVGSVVAQMDLDEPVMDYDDDDDDDAGSFHTTSEYPEDDDTPYTTSHSDSDDSEDETGRSKRPQITSEYRKQMQELQQRLIGNLGPAPKDEDVIDADADLDPKDVRRLVVRSKRISTSSASSDNSEKKPTNKKRVSFAEELDVAEPGSPPLKAQKHHIGENVTPVADTIAERTTSSSLASNTSTGKPSRFRKDRAALSTSSNDGQDTSLSTTGGSANTDLEDSLPLRTTLLERPLAKGTTASAPSLEDHDPVAARRELAEAYYSRRNDLIWQQGGFKADVDEDEEMGELMEEKEDGTLKKVSRFKAARIKGQ